MRGKQGKPMPATTPTRLIPAHAGKTDADSALMHLRRAHPRACGENSHGDASHCVAAGSSPRMRGKPLFYRHGEPIGGLIPAHAGKTETSTARRAHVWAHPRACGENGIVASSMISLMGSSPRMRGKLYQARLPGPRLRLIPAHAGKTGQSQHWSCSLPAHPRACGENPREAQWIEAQQGSSPRMRGKPMTSLPCATRGRLIPAHAGKTAAA